MKKTVQNPPHDPFDLINAQTFLASFLLQKALDIDVQILKHQIQLLSIFSTMQDIQELDNSWMVELLEKADLPQFHARYALFRMLDLDFLQRDSLFDR